MKLLRTVAEVRGHRSKLGPVAFVPTMGAFHEGHLELMRRARSFAPTVYVSLFVNPKQFGPSEDFAAYPRDESRDLALAESAGVDAVWAPTVEEVYAPGVPKVEAGPEALRWEGEHRPGHFDGVATVVARLFDVVTPDVAIFGLKDLQQCAVIRAMVERLSLPVKLEFVETVREKSGLAMSSRNAYLTTKQREEAAFLYRTLTKCAVHVRRAPSSSEPALSDARAELERHGFTPDYVACVDPATMEPSNDLALGLRVASAARYCGVRLLDNVPV